MFKNGDDLR
jgi:phosphatidylinositol-4,5-bisphosphate 3-kinase catalytic subunit alpha/beta/delta